MRARCLFLALLLTACGGDSPLEPPAPDSHPLSGCTLENVRSVQVDGVGRSLRSVWSYTDSTYTLVQDVDGLEVWRSSGPLRVVESNGVEVSYVLERWEGEWVRIAAPNATTVLSAEGPWVSDYVIGFKFATVDGREYELDCR